MIGLRREDKNDWERRVALTPDHVAELIAERGVAVRVQPSPLRAFPEVDYRRVGAEIDEALDGCRVILGIKEVPPARLARGAVYGFFAHVTKGQAYNMGMLSRLMDLGCTLIDYEEIRDEKGRRFVFFGRHAGYAGMIDTLWALGRRLADEGWTTPLERVRLAHDYSGLDEATQHLSRLGEALRHEGLPEGLRPVVVGFTGSGNVFQGAREILERLPTQTILPEEIAGLAVERERPHRVLYAVPFTREDRFERIGGGTLDPGELREHPERYRSGISRWLGELTVLLHGAYWEPGQPRVVSRADVERLWAGEKRPRLRVIADISCDIRGGVEVNLRATSPGAPVYVYDVASGEAMPGIRGHGPVIMSIDNLPCQLPAEASAHFGDTLLRYVPALARCVWERPFAELPLPEEIRRAIIVHRGELTPRWSFLADHVAAASTRAADVPEGEPR